MQSRLAECLTRAQSSRVSWRKILLLHLWSFVPLWDRYFPSHDLGSGRLKRQSLAGSEAEPDDRDLGEQKTQRGDYWSGPSWREAARQYQAARAGRLLITETEPQRLSWLRELFVNEISLDRAWRELNELSRQAAPQVTLDALIYELRLDGLAALEKPNCRRRLADLSDGQLRELIAALIRARTRCAAITDELLITLDGIRR
jgi:hypothetical protein